MQHQQRQEGALLPALQLDCASLHVDLERTQDTELDLVQPSGFTTVKREFLGRRRE